MRVYLENSQATIPVRSLDRDTAVETSWPQQCFIQSIRSVGSSDNHHGLAGIKAVHLHQQLVQRLFTLIVAIDAGTALPTHGVDFIDKDDAGSGFLGLVKQVTHTAGTHTNQYFDKLGTAHGE